MRSTIPESMLASCLQMAHKSLYTNQSLVEFLQSEIDGAKAWMETPEFQQEFADDLDAARKVSVKEITAAQVRMKTVKDRGEFLAKRLDHALSALKRKKLWTGSAENLLDLTEQLGMTRERSILQMVRCAFGCAIMVVGERDELDDTAWKIGIELTMIQHEDALCDSDDLFGLIIAKYAGDIFINTMISAYGCKFLRISNSDDYLDEFVQPAILHCLNNATFLDKILGQIMEAVDETQNETNHELATAHKKLETLSQELDQLKKTISDQDRETMKHIAPIQARIEKAAAHEAELKAEIDSLHAENQALSDQLAQSYRRISELSGGKSQADDLSNLPELPEDNVLFVGGHVNMVKKFMHNHPGWAFLDGADVNFTTLQAPSLVFFWDKHMAHPTWHRVRKFLPPGTPQAYLKSTNIEMLEAEMRRAWAAVMPDNAPASGI